MTDDASIKTWLQERTKLSRLPDEAIDAIAKHLQAITIAANRHLVTAGASPQALYILQQGQLAILKHNNQPGKILSPGELINIQELLLESNISQTLTTLTEVRLWSLPAATFNQIAREFPQVFQTFSQSLLDELTQVSAQLSFEQQRQAALRPYIVPKARRGIVGSSRYAVRLRQQIKKASNDAQSTLIFGEPGLGKDNIAALIHFGSPQRRQPIIKVNSGLLQPTGADLFGRAGGKPGLIEWLDEGTLVLNNIQDLPKELCPQIEQLLKTGTYTPVSRGNTTDNEPRTCRARIVLVSEKTQPNIERWATHTIKVPPLRVRKSDLKTQVEYYISLYCRSKAIPKPKITPEAIRRLQSYDFPGNLQELQSLVERAIQQIGGAQELTEEVFWSADNKKKRFRWNLLNAYPNFRNFLRSPWWPDRINYWFTTWFFALVVLILFIGPQERHENFALNMFWAWWWPVVLLIFPFLGRIWCAVCPFMIYGEIAQKVSLWLFPRKLKKWPRERAEKYGGWFLFGLFALIFLWEELWHLENTAYLSSCLLLLITAGAVIFSTIFERRFWCRYLCPIGGMNGLFAKLSITELRAQQGICSATCTTYQCYKGGPEKGEGQETDGCPLYSHPAQLQDNRDCVLCMTCLKACPHRSVEVNLRPPGIELWTTHIPRSYEVALLLLLLGGIFLRRLPQIEQGLGVNMNVESLDLTHAGFSMLALALPALLPLLAQVVMVASYKIAHYVGNNWPKPRPFVEMAYGYLPLVLGGNLAHYLHLGLTEGGRLLPVAMTTFGLSGEQMPALVAHPAVVSFLQGTTVLVSMALTFFLTNKIARQPLKAIWPQHVAAIALGSSFWLFIVNMKM
jgi:transcriptional regulator with AAA-type ATPase domain/NAD-dependent dihydropyrimidine dehydrogenase PreA subunit